MIGNALTRLILEELQTRDDPSDVNLADGIGLDAGTLRRLLGQLRDRGLVAREESHADGSAHWGVTAAGQRWLDRRKDERE
jgi:DNA-binding MarR family transcriptional regulator